MRLRGSIIYARTTIAGNQAVTSGHSWMRERTVLHSGALPPQMERRQARLKRRQEQPRVRRARRGLNWRDPARGQQGHHGRQGVFGRDGGPMVRPELLGLVVDPRDAPPKAPFYPRIADLLAARVTSMVKRPAPSGMMTRRPWA